MKYIFRKILYSISFLTKMPNDFFELSIFRNHMRKIIFNKENLYFWDNCNNNNKIQINSSKRNILVVTHDFSRTGAPKVALDLCKSLKEIYQAEICVVGPEYGKLQDDFVNQGFRTFYYSDLPKKKSSFVEFCNKFDLIIISSLAREFFYALDVCQNIKTPIVWYTHEIHKKDDKFVKIALRNSIIILCGSPLTEQSIKNINKNAYTKLLMYGIKEETISSLEEDIVIFICAGTIGKRKNQKTFVEAIKLMPDDLRQKSMFYIIGSPLQKEDFKYELELKNITKNFDNVKFIENIPQKELLEYYKKSDCLVCTSIQDPLPIVVTLCFMFGKIPIISNKIGQALLCENGKNAILFEPTNSQELSNLMSEIIKNKNKLKYIGVNSRDIYDKYFSMDSFKKNIKKYLDEVYKI